MPILYRKHKDGFGNDWIKKTDTNNPRSFTFIPEDLDNVDFRSVKNQEREGKIVIKDRVID